MDLDKLETDARAKIFWGETPESVVAYLQTQGATAEEAQAITDSMQRERIASIKSAGWSKIGTGVLLILIPVAVYFFLISARRLGVKLFGVSLFFGVYGAWKLINGINHVVHPERESGDLADFTQDDDD